MARSRRSSTCRLVVLLLAGAYWLCATANAAWATSQSAAEVAPGRVVTEGANPQGPDGLPIKIDCFGAGTFETQTGAGGYFSIDLPKPGGCIV